MDQFRLDLLHKTSALYLIQALRTSGFRLKSVHSTILHAVNKWVILCKYFVLLKYSITNMTAPNLAVIRMMVAKCKSNMELVQWRVLSQKLDNKYVNFYLNICVGHCLYCQYLCGWARVCWGCQVNKNQQ